MEKFNWKCSRCYAPPEGEIIVGASFDFYGIYPRGKWWDEWYQGEEMSPPDFWALGKPIENEAKKTCKHLWFAVVRIIFGYAWRCLKSLFFASIIVHLVKISFESWVDIFNMIK